MLTKCSKNKRQKKETSYTKFQSSLTKITRNHKLNVIHKSASLAKTSNNCNNIVYQWSH